LIRIDRHDARIILEHHGGRSQKYKCAEELAELSTVLLQDANQSGKIPLRSIEEEMADVYVMLEQMKILYDIADDEVEDIAIDKIARTIQRMGAEVAG